jgi:hypothetical protein
MKKKKPKFKITELENKKIELDVYKLFYTIIC